jgi:hypothetical protein
VIDRRSSLLLGGLTIAVAVVVVPQVVSYSNPVVVTALVFCPSSLVNILVLVTFQHPPLSWLVAVQSSSPGMACEVGCTEFSLETVDPKRRMPILHIRSM